MKKTILILSVATMYLVACNNNSETQQEIKDTAATKTDTAAVPAKDGWADLSAPQKEKAIRDLVPNTAGNIGWSTEGSDDVLSFSADGKVQYTEKGKVEDGTWRLAGDQLTINWKEDKGEPTLYTAKVDADKLVLGDKVYTRKAGK